VIDELFVDRKGKWVFNFLDDLVVYSASIEEHMSHVREVVLRLQEAGFTLNPNKVTLGATEIKYLGHLISAWGIRVLPDRVTAIQRYPGPSNLRALWRFLGMVGFYIRFILDFSRRAALLLALKKGVPFHWDNERQDMFDALKQALCKVPVLQEFELHCDNLAVLVAQEGEGCEPSGLLDPVFGPLQV
jgi:hypothetical protein